ncbi:hypothetical protein F4U02_08890 [Acinetobacter haemolyticus]|uniref:Uncharacterized protein n=1 Tax=Acinetobacter haemolyticus TaxID=29430 RepID=A0A2K8PZB5_ACIHA|nr:hypothetical protein BSR56_10900 [Acinetobacter haemolyticus]AZN68474.1 hypothetical protein DX910_09560 [Acinetobacter haemolyticus]MQZ31107.1 hypothetical protein [Acinetobacter haemolyticus]QDJ91671.1 hypothetical protein AhaeAN54_006050 [Acinetobacter haemolyticus]QHI09531.1 hypothetical protein AhaeAN59_05120 [Acinetobacter haemolyticus]
MQSQVQSAFLRWSVNVYKTLNYIKADFFVGKIYYTTKNNCLSCQRIHHFQRYMINELIIMVGFHDRIFHLYGFSTETGSNWQQY